VRAVAAWTLIAIGTGLVADARSTIADRVMTLTRQTAWRPAGSVRIQFRTWHPQGLVRIGEAFFVSSVEVRSRERGEGVGHLFKIDKAGALVADLTLGEGAIYHPGGIDYDGAHIWVPVAEYRPDSRSIVYRVDPVSMKATEVFRFADHIGAIVHNTDEGTLHGVSWGSRRIYRWKVGGERDAPVRAINPSHYVDYQDCKYVGARRMLCTGVTELTQSPQAASFRLGGIELVDLAEARPIFQVPLLLWTAGGVSMTQNPAWFDATPSGLRGYFMPEDDTSTLYIYDAEAAR
jgi:Family of unknown function (DUF6454)